jgi:hypothetical protein
MVCFKIYEVPEFSEIYLLRKTVLVMGPKLKTCEIDEYTTDGSKNIKCFFFRIIN